MMLSGYEMSSSGGSKPLEYLLFIFFVVEGERVREFLKNASQFQDRVNFSRVCVSFYLEEKEKQIVKLNH